MGDETQASTSVIPTAPPRWTENLEVRRFVIEVVAGPDAGKSVVAQGERCAIGSHPSNDLALGDPDSVGRGVGRRALLEFVHHVVRPAVPDATEVWIDPDPRNERAVRSYRAVGFVDTGIDLPDPERPGATRRLMKLTFPGPAFR